MRREHSRGLVAPAHGAARLSTDLAELIVELPEASKECPASCCAPLGDLPEPLHRLAEASKSAPPPCPRLLSEAWRVPVFRRVDANSGVEERPIFPDLVASLGRSVISNLLVSQTADLLTSAPSRISRSCVSFFGSFGCCCACVCSRGQSGSQWNLLEGHLILCHRTRLCVFATRS